MTSKHAIAITLRPITPEDEAFLFGVYAAGRREEPVAMIAIAGVALFCALRERRSQSEAGLVNAEPAS